MNNIIKNSLLWLVLAVILTIPCVLGYNTTNNLVAYYNFEQGNNTFVTDVTTNNHNQINCTTNLTSRIGFINSSASSLSTCKMNNTINMTDFSISFWYRSNDTASSDVIIWFYNSTTVAFNLQFGNFASGNNLGSYSDPLFTDLTLTGLSANTWNHVVLTYNKNHSERVIYLNGVLFSDLTSQYLISIPKIDLNLVVINHGSLDEVSIWNTSLNGFDVIELYNGGLGQSYTDTTTPPVINLNPQCIDEYTYCSDVRVNGIGQIFCNSYEEPIAHFCSGGCNNVTCIETGIAECAFLGEKKCYDTTNYRTCDDSDTDGYLDYGTVTTCAVGTYCVQSYKLAYCANVTTTGTHDAFGLIVSPYVVNDNATTYSVNTATRTVGVLTTNLLHNQLFYTSGTTFLSRTCDYKETATTITSGSTYINESNTFVFSSATGINNIFRISFTPAQYDNGTIELVSSTATTMSAIKWSHNFTKKEFCIYDNAMTQIVCDYDYSATDTLKNVFLEYTFDMSSKTYTIKMVFNRTIEQVKYTYPLVLFGSDIASLIFNANDTTLNYFNDVTIPSFSPFEQNANATLVSVVDKGFIFFGEDTINTTVKPLLPVPCLYTTTGVRTVRTYGNNLAHPDYSNYQDYNINVNDLGLTPTELQQKSGTLDFLGGSNLNQGTKYLIILAIIMVTIIGFIATGYSLKMVQGSAVVGSSIAFFELVIFTVAGWINWVVIVMVLIVAIAVIILMSKTNHSEADF